MGTYNLAGEKQFDDVDDIKTSIRRCLLKRFFTDVEFRVETGQPLKSIYAHKLVLSCRSAVLADIFNKGADTSLFTVSHVEAPGIERMIRYIYFDEFVSCSVSDLIQTLKVATKFEIKSLQNLCISRFTDLEIKADNVFEVLDAADFIRDEGIRQKCLKFLISDTETVLNSSAFKDASLVTILCILRLPELNIYSEACLLEAAIEWLNHNPNCSSKDELLSYIDITTLSTEEFLEIVEKFPSFFSDSEIVKILLNIRHSGSRNLPTFCVTHSVGRKFLKQKISIPRNFQTMDTDATTSESKSLPTEMMTGTEAKTTAVVTASKCIQTSDCMFTSVTSISEQRNQLKAEWRCYFCGRMNFENIAEEVVPSSDNKNFKNQLLSFKDGHFSDSKINTDNRKQELSGMSSKWYEEQELRQLGVSPLSNENACCQDIQMHRCTKKCLSPRNKKYKTRNDEFQFLKMMNRPVNQTSACEGMDNSHYSQSPLPIRTEDLASNSVLPPRKIDDINSLSVLPSRIVGGSNSKPLPQKRMMKIPDSKPTLPAKPLRIQAIPPRIIKGDASSKPVPPARMMESSSNKPIPPPRIKKDPI